MKLDRIGTDTPRPLRALYVVPPALGAVLVALGLYGDSSGFWNGRGFLANLLSVFAGVLFGVPFALLVSGRLASAQAEIRERREARRLAGRVVRSLHEAVCALMRSGEHDKALEKATAVEASLEHVKGRLVSVEDLDSALVHDLSQAVPAREWNAEEVQEVLSAVAGKGGHPLLSSRSPRRLRMVETRAIVCSLASAMREAHGLWLETYGAEPAAETQWANISHQWRTLQEVVRPRFFELGLPWADISLVLATEALSGRPRGSGISPEDWYGKEAARALEALDDSSVPEVLKSALMLSASGESPPGVRFEEIIENGLHYARHVRMLLENAIRIRALFDIDG
ncbi:hypothetical protein [Thermomonospora echinospora]|nr:hypothetical protein [Thermomonospora echinospora]